jgi:hypothetical protein
LLVSTSSFVWNTSARELIVAVNGAAIRLLDGIGGSLRSPAAVALEVDPRLPGREFGLMWDARLLRDCEHANIEDRRWDL